MIRRDPAFAACGGTLERYANHLLEACAYAIAKEKERSCAIGIADRYGGLGIGKNGGSGRAVLVNDYYVKGVGRTPLIGALTDEAHASGGAYLEECVRETIFSELAGSEFPGGAVPTLAIIDTGLVQVWQRKSGPYPERRCLLVRPGFLRPAHFERASGHLSADPRDGYSDAQRVRCAYQTAIELWGRAGLLAAYKKLWLTWAEQLAYAYVHRLPHGGDTTSNIAMDGRLLDFGGMTAIPSWARISLAWNIWRIPDVGDSPLNILQAIRTHSELLGKYVDADLANHHIIEEVSRVTLRRYQNVLVREILRLVGLSREQADLLLHKVPGAASVAGRVVSHYRRDHFTLFEGTPIPHIPWDIDQFWSSAPPYHWRALREMLQENQKLLCKSGEGDLKMFAGRVKLRGRDRPKLYRHEFKRELSHHLENEMEGDLLNQHNLGRLISTTVCENRRDSSIEPDNAVPVGFAQNETESYALFRSTDTDKLFAKRESWRDSEATAAPNKAKSVVAISELAEKGFILSDASLALMA